jgi:hypothetical protein
LDLYHEDRWDELVLRVNFKQVIRDMDAARHMIFPQFGTEHVDGEGLVDRRLRGNLELRAEVIGAA